MKVKWRKIKPYKYYYINNYGTIKRIAHRVLCCNATATYTRLLPAKIMKPYIDKRTGYYDIQLYDNRQRNIPKLQKRHTYQVHRLVAQVFIPNPYHYPDVNHKNEDRLDDRVSNLEWCTTKYNCNYGNGLIKNYLSKIYNNRKNISYSLLDKHDKLLIKQLLVLIPQLNCEKYNFK